MSTAHTLSVSAEARAPSAYVAEQQAPLHTPGPWRWHGRSLRAVTQDPHTSAVHTILEAEGGSGYLMSDHHNTHREIDACMRVIEQAPVMLGLLQELMGTRDSFGNYGVSRELEQRLYAAIADATVAAV